MTGVIYFHNIFVHTGTLVMFCITCVIELPLSYLFQSFNFNSIYYVSYSIFRYSFLDAHCHSRTLNCINLYMIFSSFLVCNNIERDNFVSNSPWFFISFKQYQAFSSMVLRNPSPSSLEFETLLSPTRAREFK